MIETIDINKIRTKIIGCSNLRHATEKVTDITDDYVYFNRHHKWSKLKKMHIGDYYFNFISKFCFPLYTLTESKMSTEFDFCFADWVGRKFGAIIESHGNVFVGRYTGKIDDQCPESTDDPMLSLFAIDRSEKRYKKIDSDMLINADIVNGLYWQYIGDQSK